MNGEEHDTNINSLDSIHRELIGVLDQYYFIIAKVDLLQDTVCMLQCAGHSEVIGKVMSWTEHLHDSTAIMTDEHRALLRGSFSSAHLLNTYRSGETDFSLDASYVKEGVTRWLTTSAFFKEEDERVFAYVMVRIANRDHLRKSIVDLYVYNNCDYFIFLDAKNNSYTMFGGAGNSTPLPPTLGDDYEAEVVKYADQFVVPEDREFVIREMAKERVLSKLDQGEVHSFHCGVVDPVRGYTRKRLDYRYYDRKAQTIMLTRTDVTEMYLEEQRHYRELAEALKRAQTDALTGLFNYEGIVEKITEQIEAGAGHAALLFVDLDNFKGVNDSLGHDVGDEVLRGVASILRREAFGNSLIGRFGGDEFIVFFSHIGSMEEVTSYAQRVCDAVVALEYGKREEDPHVSCSIGIAEAPKDGVDYVTLVRKADDRTYRAKAAGKNQFSC